MKRLLAVVLACLMLTAAAGCGETNQPEPGEYDGYSQLLVDPDFELGFTVATTMKGNDAGIGTRKVIDYGGTVTEEPFWEFAQHQCNKSLRNGQELIDGDVYTYTDTDDIATAAKKFVIDRKTHEIQLNCDTSKDYEHPRLANEGWIHMLLGQGFCNETEISVMDELILDIEWTITKMDNMLGADYNPSIHAAQFQLFFVMSGVAGEEFWFGMPFYDVRETELTEPNGLFDKGTNMYISSMGNAAYMDELATVGKRVVIKHDVLPDMKTALENAKAKGYMQSTRFEDLTLVNMNIGWEIPGTFDVGLTIHSFDLMAKIKAE